MEVVILGKLYRSGRPGYTDGRFAPVGIGPVQEWIDAAQAVGVASIICLLSPEQLALYPEGELLYFYAIVGFIVHHISTDAQSDKSLSSMQLMDTLTAYCNLPKPVLVHGNAGGQCSTSAVQHILAHAL